MYSELCKDAAAMEKQTRLISLDFFRGFIMLLLVGESTHLYGLLADLHIANPILAGFVQQFHHHPWNGLRFWDLIQPGFMFIVGVAMVFSLAKRSERGDSKTDITRHIVQRCVLLLLFGTGLHCVYRHELVFELWNVLTQLSFTILFAFLIFKLPIRTQFLISIGLLVLTEVLYRLWPVPGFDQPFTPDQNFGSWLDMLLMGKLSGGHWVAINALPTAAHTIWGVLAGKLLRSDRPPHHILRLLLFWGALGLLVGYGLDGLGITPIIKRICTSSFVIVSGGWVVLLLAASYWLIDVVGMKSWTFLFVVVGMNPIFIYLFTQTVGHQWVNETVFVFSGGLLQWLGMGAEVAKIINAVIVWTLEWGLCLWLFRRRIFIKI